MFRNALPSAWSLISLVNPCLGVMILVVGHANPTTRVWLQIIFSVANNFFLL